MNDISHVPIINKDHIIMGAVKRTYGVEGIIIANNDEREFEGGENVSEELVGGQNEGTMLLIWLKYYLFLLVVMSLLIKTCRRC